MKFKVLTLFPENLKSSLDYGVIGRAQKQNIIDIEYINPRDYSDNNYGSIDDKPYGGGPGMVIKADPLLKAIEFAKGGTSEICPVVFLSPQGLLFNQKTAESYAKFKDLILVSGRYEGIDERVIELTENALEISLGSFVLSGGEIAASAMIDSITRLIPGVLGHEMSALQDSFTEDLLDYPHYTRPELFRNIAVPKVLVSGNHHEINRWRLKQALGRTYQRRPDLLEQRQLSDDETVLLEEYQEELSSQELAKNT
jgi:tRNA (guanine37-N1)-methyltransferase